ncbi:11188_t:CDS:1 [Scutellospora calospora]|uniref:11188_t:CDS:1 n=1 Tax=Scutellospora calospora TaxID=85575 RepID=A0ACA9JV31_9GLOM|nr:11188_t:CDS:1 [Scutellospora calospora]
MSQDQYHHYIPRFILRNFANDKYERIFVSDKKLFNKKRKKILLSKKKSERLQTYDRSNDQLGISLIAKTYGFKNLYKDLNHDDTMRVENKLSKLENEASNVVRDIITASQQDKSHIVLLRKNLANLRKFLFIMNYRKTSRKDQFLKEEFDIPTLLELKNFMKQNNIQNSQEVWLQNIDEILDTPHQDVKNNEQIFSADRMDYKRYANDYFLAIWQAGENDEFIITSNTFGLFEGVIVDKIFLDGRFQKVSKAFHYFYVISPKLVLVLCDWGFRDGIGFEYLDNLFGFKHRSFFENVSHPKPIPDYVNKMDPSQLNIRLDSKFNRLPNIVRHDDDKFTFQFGKINSATVNLVNYIILNEAESDINVSFCSLLYLYKTIIKYYKNYKDIFNYAENTDGITCKSPQDFSNLKKTLFMTLNKTHEEDLNLRKNILSSSIDWNLFKFDTK